MFNSQGFVYNMLGIMNTSAGVRLEFNIRRHDI